MLKQQVIEKAHELGFSSCRITTAEPVPSEMLTSWLSEGKQGTMRWMERDPAARCDPASLLPGARSVICCALVYGEYGLVLGQRAFPTAPTAPVQRRLARGRRRGAADPMSSCSEHAQRARFTRGVDYHDVVREKIERLAGVLSAAVPGARTRCCVDTSPLMEKALAARAGIGWIGRNTLLVNREFGSWFVLGEVIADIELEPDGSIENGCGDCRRCLRSCPTGALDEHSLDARRCISYLTIEHRGPIDERFQPFIGSGAYGCDRCQEACPYNRSK